MPEYDQSVIDLFKTAVRDAQDLVRSEIALAKAELRAEGRRMSLGAGFLAGAVVAALLTLTFLLSTLAWGLAAAFAWSAWIGFAVVTFLMLIVTVVLASMGRKKLAGGPKMARTIDTMKENAKWIRARTS